MLRRAEESSFYQRSIQSRDHAGQQKHITSPSNWVTKSLHFLQLLHNKSLPLVHGWKTFSVKRQQQEMLGLHEHY